jgi:uridine kinase
VSAAGLLDAVEAAAPRLGGRCRVVAIDGTAGAGKTTLAAALATEARGRGHDVAVVHMDDLYDGWRGVLVVGRQVGELLDGLHRTGSASYRRYDWHRSAYGDVRAVALPDVLVLEGVGCCDPASEDLLSLQVWVEAPAEVRLARGLQRDGEHLREKWLTFMADEKTVHARDRTRERADVVVDGVTGAVADLRRQQPVRRRPAPGPHGPR